MQHVYSKRSNRQSWPIKALAIAVVIGLTGTVTQAATVNRKPIGDLEIYARASFGKELALSLIHLLKTGYFEM